MAQEQMKGQKASSTFRIIKRLQAAWFQTLSELAHVRLAEEETGDGEYGRTASSSQHIEGNGGFGSGCGGYFHSKDKKKNEMIDENTMVKPELED